MNCPMCALPLVQKQFKGRPADVDYCETCHGIWFDDGELSSTINVPARNLSPPADARPSSLRCPRCEEPLVWFAYPGTMTVIDGCRTCRGVWLDGGEFQEIVRSRDASRAPQQTIPLPPAAPVPAPVREPAPAPNPEAGGVKDQLIRFIDRSIESLWTGIRS